jgi:uncharacterized protein (DUF1501 family)
MKMFSRRRFIQCCGAGLTLRAFGTFALETASRPPGRMIVLLLRGGLDGLFVMSPVADPRLSELRPSLARTVLAQGAMLGTTGFAAHPSAKVLADLFAARELAFAPCAGTVDTSRSHFQAQDILELGSGAAQGNSGFMARAAQALEANAGAISFTREVPLCFRGGEIPPEVAPLSGSGLKLPEGRLLQAIRSAHRGHRTGDALEQAIATEAEIETAMGMEPQAARGAPGANGLGNMAAVIGRILRGNTRLGLAFLDLGGLDTHANEEAALSRSLQSIGEGITKLRDALGDVEWRRTHLAIMSEFGRTVRENGTQGTDHGRGGLFIIAGGGIAGGRMIADFNGLADPALNENRDLPVLADWRDLLAASLRDTCGFGDSTLDTIFPGRPRQRFEI